MTRLHALRTLLSDLRPKGFAVLVATLFLAMAAHTQLMAQTGARIMVTDALGRQVAVPTTMRVLSLGPDVTEIVYALGAGDRLVGVDRSSRYPEETNGLANVGYRRALSAEGVLSLKPELILAAEDIGPPEVVDILKAFSVPVVFIPEDNSMNGVTRKIALIAETLGREEEGRKLAGEIARDFGSVSALIERVPAAARKKVVFFHGLARLTAAGGGTAADAIIRHSGGINPFGHFDGYKAASEEALLAMEPQAILMMADGRGGPVAEDVFAAAALSTSPAARDRALIVLDGPYMLGFGPRTADAIRALALALYPDYLAD